MMPPDPIATARELVKRLRQEAKGYREIQQAGTEPKAPWAALAAQLETEAEAIEQLIAMVEGRNG